MKQSKENIANLKSGRFKLVYENLKDAGYSYNIETFSHDFGSVNSFLKYTYLLYVISREECVDLHLLACEFLVYTDTICDDIYSLVRWHILQAQSIEPCNTKISEWVISYFSDCPSSPFSEAELKAFRHQI